jgi:hypothetical protein
LSFLTIFIASIPFKVLLSGVLTKNDGNKLISNLNTAIKYLDARQANRAIKELNAFITQVEVDVQRGELSSTQGQALVDEANSVPLQKNPF